MLYLEHGDANTKLFHLQACHRSRKNYIHSLTVAGHVVVNNEHMVDALFDHFNGLLGSPAQRSRTARFDLLNHPTLDLSSLDVCFTEDEIWAVVRDIPAEKAPGPDGFTGLFYKKKKAWPIIKADVVAAFNAFWSLDDRNFHLINVALMVLLRKKSDTDSINDYRPISLMHSFGKPNQTAFI